MMDTMCPVPAAVEGEALTGETLAGVVVWANRQHPPLLRINPQLVGAEQRPSVLAWADRQLSEGQAVGILRGDDVADLLPAARCRLEA